MQGDAIMKMIALATCCGVAALSMTATTAMSDDRLVGTLPLSAVDASCPATLAPAAQTVPVNFQMPETWAQAHPAVQNRFRFNSMEPARKARTVTITGQIADYGVAGCTVAFKGEGVSVD
jgi:hypothetical protein